MLNLYCPYCQEKREEVEFHYAGEAFIERPNNVEQLSDEEWGDYLFHRDNHKGSQYEQWTHNAACRKYFIVKRNTATYEIEDVWRFDDPALKKIQSNS